MKIPTINVHPKNPAIYQKLVGTSCVVFPYDKVIYYITDNPNWPILLRNDMPTQIEVCLRDGRKVQALFNFDYLLKQAQENKDSPRELLSGAVEKVKIRPTLLELKNDPYFVQLPIFNGEFYITKEGKLYSVINNNVREIKVMYRNNTTSGWVVLTRNGKRQCFMFPKLMEMAFNLSKPSGYKFIGHKDGNPKNNALSNLCYYRKKAPNSVNTTRVKNRKFYAWSEKGKTYYTVDSKGVVLKYTKTSTGFKSRPINPILTNKHAKNYCVTLIINGKRKKVMVYRMVAEKYLPNPNNYTCIRHLDNDATNNCVENLEWVKTLKRKQTPKQQKIKQVTQLETQPETQPVNINELVKELKKVIWGDIPYIKFENNKWKIDMPELSSLSMPVVEPNNKTNKPKNKKYSKKTTRKNVDKTVDNVDSLIIKQLNEPTKQTKKQKIEVLDIKQPSLLQRLKNKVLGWLK